MAFLKDHLKSFVAVILCFTLILSSFALAFADSEEEAVTSSEEASSEALPSSALLATVTDEDEIALDNAMRELSVKLASTSTEYTANDIYNLLISFRTVYNQNNNFRVYDSAVLAQLGTMQSAILSNIAAVNNSLNYNSNGTNFSAGELLTILVRAIGVYDSESPDIYSNMNSIVEIVGNINNLITTSNTFTVGGVTYTLPELQYNSQTFARLIHNNVSDIKTIITNMNASLTSFITANHLDLTAIDSSVDDFASANHSDLTAIDSSISDFNDDFNRLDWSVLKSSAISITDSIGGDSLSVGSVVSDIVYEYDFFYSPVSHIFKFSLGIRPENYVHFPDLDISIYSTDSSFNYRQYVPASFDYDFSQNSCDIYVYDFSSWLPANSNRHFYLCINSSSPLRFDSNTSSLSAVNDSNIDYYTVYGWLNSRHDSKVIDKFEYLYASDDLIAAKDAQQEQEDTALEEFTGGGSAAASVNDIGSAKDVSSGLKNGLSSGGSASAPLGVMDSGSGFWDWFSSETMGNLDNTQSNRSLRSSGGEEYIDFYSRNWEQIQDYLGGNR